jgi:cytochrome P450
MANSARTNIPEHVPAALVRDFRLDLLPGMEKDPIAAVNEAVKDAPDIFYGTNARVGMNTWVIKPYELMLEAFQDTATFSSRETANFSSLVGETWRLLPLEADPPEHGAYRAILNPWFSPSRMKLLEEEIRDLAVELIEGLATKGACEFMSDFAEVFPIQIFLRMFGLPISEAHQFVTWNRGIGATQWHEHGERSARAIVDYLRNAIAEREKRPADDLMSYVVTAQVNERALTENEKIGMCFLLYVAGLDTVTNQLGFIFKHLAENPEDQQKLRDEPELVPNAIEEFIRGYGVVNTVRLVTRDLNFHGVDMKSGDLIFLLAALSGRDEEKFENASTIDYTRKTQSHISFAAGPHRCAGSHLARRELRAALEEWLAHVPTFRIKDGETPRTGLGGVMTVFELPLAWS